MLTQVQDRRRHARMAFVCPVLLRDKRGRILFKGRTADVSPSGIKMMGPGPCTAVEGGFVWVELMAPNTRVTGPRRRVVKLRGHVRRVTDMGQWKSIIVILLESDFTTGMIMS